MSAGVNGEGLEIEIKVVVADRAHFLSRVETLGFRCATPRTHEYNEVLDRPDRPLSKEQKLLRLRRWGSETILTFKTPAEVNERTLGYKVRKEFEVTVGEFDTTRSILNQMGFQKVFSYEKYRSVFLSPEGMVLTLDETPIGLFAELEGPPDWIDRTLVALGYQKADAICQNYRSLFLAAGGRGDMLFQATK